MDDDAPYIYQRDGKAAGMIVSVLDHFAENFDGTVHYTFCSNAKDAEQKLKEGNFDIVIGMSFTSKYCAKNGLIRSDLLMEAELASFYRRGDGNKDVLAVVEGLENAIDTSEWRTVIIFSNTEKCVKAVAEGVADAGVGDHNSVEYYTYDTSNNLIISTISGHTSSICLAVNKKRDMEFLGILNAYLYSLSDTEKTAYLSDGNIHLRKISLKYFASQYPGKLQRQISAQVTEQDADHVSCRFKVADTGIGMSEEFQKHMFEQFTQEHEDDRTEYKGTGLGLAIVKRIVEKMGGEIRVNSKKDVGTEFIWTLTFATDKDFVEKVYVQEEGTDSHSDCMERKF